MQPPKMRVNLYGSLVAYEGEKAEAVGNRSHRRGSSSSSKDPEQLTLQLFRKFTGS